MRGLSLVCAALNLVASSSLAGAASITMETPARGSYGYPEIHISLEGEIGEGDGNDFAKKLEDARDALFKRDHPELDIGLSSPDVLSIRLELDSKTGGDLYAALKIAGIVREEGIETIVKKGKRCASACGLIFLAGEIHQPYSDVEGYRTIEAGGYVFLHAPYIRRRAGTFAEGRSAVRRMLQVLGPRLKPDLAVEILRKEPNDYLSIDTVADAIKWDVRVDRFRLPWPRRAGFQQACENYFKLKKQRLLGSSVAEETKWIEVPQGPNVDGDAPKEEEVKPATEPVVESNEPAFENSDALTKLETSLLREDSPELDDIRKTYNAPDLMRMVYIGGGKVASQFIFSNGESEPLTCTVWSGQNGLFISQRQGLKISTNSLKREGDLGRPAYVPYWYQFPPDTLLSSIADRQ